MRNAVLFHATAVANKVHIVYLLLVLLFQLLLSNEPRTKLLDLLPQTGILLLGLLALGLQGLFLLFQMFRLLALSL